MSERFRQGADVRSFPFHLRPIFHGDAYQILAFVTPKKRRFTCQLTGSLADGQQVVFPLPIDVGAASQGTIVHTLVAREAIRDLQEGASYLHLATDATQAGSASDLQARVKAEIMSLGLSYNLASEHTSFLAIEERADADTATPATKVDVPQHPPANCIQPRSNQGRTGAAPKVDGLNQRRLRSRKASKALGGATSGVQDMHKKRRVSPNQASEETRPCLATPFGFSAAPSQRWSSYGEETRMWSPTLTHGFAGPRGSRRLCWLTSAVAFVMTVAPWREALLQLVATANVAATAANVATTSNVSLLQRLAQLVRSWVGMQADQQHVQGRGFSSLVSKRRAVHEALDQLALAFEGHGMATGHDQSVILAVQVVGAALDSYSSQQVQCFLCPPVLSTVPRPSVTGTLAVFQQDLVRPTTQHIVFLNPDCGMLPAIVKGFTLQAFLALETLRNASQNNEHCVCVATSSNGAWIFDDNLNEKGFQGGKIDGSLEHGYVQHFKERVPVFAVQVATH